ncbi:hypothetical protein WISP_109486 [Willisornis vidua]|uniref:Uncharacterized protein n=1 Tax=Willisornis vidua TaxID=1566151 RepID=A0ABQ9D1W5_9PASS|nr:hypothetical protein WISP_109486 [Willisornis vidua]
MLVHKQDEPVEEAEGKKGSKRISVMLVHKQDEPVEEAEGQRVQSQIPPQILSSSFGISTFFLNGDPETLDG